MSVIVVLLFASISVASLFLLAFLWSVKSGQFKDEEGASIRMLFEEYTAKPSVKKLTTNRQNKN
ncbi:MAG: cbb3-type cytochrome oxidase assembly protein CcoS [Bacteroidetes bacterium]|nr:MAG: cbb3-type cytochrome oxidase assembly protein CcoS [Bacteroidota bacterium]